MPKETLIEAFGQQTVDPRVELVELVVEYWTQPGIPVRLARDRILESMQGKIDSGNVYRLIGLMSKRGVAHAFFALTRSSADPRGDLRRFLLVNGVILDTIRYYDTWSGIDPKLFIDGFFVGVAESFATVVVDLARLFKLAAQMQQAQTNAIVLLATDVDAGAQNILDQAAFVGQVFDAVVAQLNPAGLPAHVLEIWRGWNSEFERDLENLDPFAAGRVLGRIGGDLWQLLTGLVALVKLLRIGIRLALQYVPLLVGVVRSIAAEASLVIRELASLYAALGISVVEGLPKVGMGMLRTLFPPEALRYLVREGRALLTINDQSMMLVVRPAWAQAFGGTGMGSHLGVLMGNEGKPLLMAAVTEAVPSGGRLATAEEATESLDEALNSLDDRFRAVESTQAPKSTTPSAAEVRAARLAMLQQRLSTQLHNLLQKVAYEVFTELRKGGRFRADELGRAIHSRMTGPVAKLVAEVSPNLQVFTERELRTVARSLAASDTGVERTLQTTGGVLEQTIAQMLVQHRDSAQLLDFLGVEGKASARSEKALAKFLGEEFGWKSTTKVGDLQSDLLLADPLADGTQSMINVDWTSSTKIDQFEKVWGKVVDDLGGNFTGDWENVADAYAKAFKGSGVPPEVAAGLEALTKHAVRETIVRRAALMAVFGDLWNIRSYEMTYDGMAKLFRTPIP